MYQTTKEIETSPPDASNRHKGHAQSSTESRNPQPATKDENHRPPSFRAATTVATQSPESQRQDRWATWAGVKDSEVYKDTSHEIVQEKRLDDTWCHHLTADQRHATQPASLVPRYHRYLAGTRLRRHQCSLLTGFANNTADSFVHNPVRFVSGTRHTEHVTQRAPPRNNAGLRRSVVFCEDSITMARASVSPQSQSQSL